MKTVDIHAAKTHLSALVEEAAAGKKIIIAKAGKPVSRRVPLTKVVSSKARPPQTPD
jgi:prevent-host-death family protein